MLSKGSHPKSVEGRSKQEEGQMYSHLPLQLAICGSRSSFASRCSFAYQSLGRGEERQRVTSGSGHEQSPAQFSLTPNCFLKFGLLLKIGRFLASPEYCTPGHARLDSQMVPGDRCSAEAPPLPRPCLATSTLWPSFSHTFSPWAFLDVNWAGGTQ